MVELDDELWSIQTLGKFLGGKKAGQPMGRAAIKRLIKAGILSPPIKLGANERYRKSTALADVARLEEARLKTAQKIESRRIKSRA